MRIEVNEAKAALLLAALSIRARESHNPNLDDLLWHIEVQVLENKRWPNDLERYWQSSGEFLAEVVDVLYDVGRDDLADVLDSEFT